MASTDHTPTRWYHRKPLHWLAQPRARAASANAQPLVFVTDPEPGVAPSDKPAVRIFLGTEPRHYRAERVFVWSVLKHRDPTRRYEIHLVKDIAGIARDGWPDAFSNYRFGVPGWAGGEGRAIWNEVHQVYRVDPAILFDMDLKGAGYAATTPHDGDVMVIDCAAMAPHWSLDGLNRGELRPNTSHAWTPLPPPGLVSFAVPHTQPWQPFPERFNYRPAPNNDVWTALEREADAAGFSLFTKARPCRRYAELLDQYQQIHDDAVSSATTQNARVFNGRSLKRNLAPVAGLVKEFSPATILDYGAGRGALYEAYGDEPLTSRYRSQPAWGGAKVICYDPGYPAFAEPFQGKAEGVISTDVVEHIWSDDVPWVVDEMFSHASKFVYVVAAAYPAKKILPNGENAHCTTEPAIWWRTVFETVSRRYPEIDWTLCIVTRPIRRKVRRYFRGKAGQSRPV